MTHEFEYMSDYEADRIAVLENKAAELERRLLAVIPPASSAGRAPDGHEPPGHDAPRPQGTVPAGTVPAGTVRAGTGRAGSIRRASTLAASGPRPSAWANVAAPDGDYPGRDYPGRGYPPPGPDSPYAGQAYEEAPDDDLDEAPAAGRTEALIRHGRRSARRSRTRRVLAHWRLLAVGVAALLAGIIAALAATGGGGGNWPASVPTVQAEIKQACENPDVAAEPTGLNFACGKSTQQVLWVFSLLTSGDNPGYVDQATGRKGLEPIQASQGGDIAWSLNLHHPYNPASPLDSLEVAARAINNIISGATLTSSNGSALIEPGLESKAANCQRYTGSSRLDTRQGYPAQCAAPVAGASGEAALVTDVFKQWMSGTPAQTATDAGVLFENAGNPGSAQVQAILASLPASGG